MITVTSSSLDLPDGTPWDKLNYLKAQQEMIISTVGADLVKDEIKPIFDNHPDLVLIHWSQYTPYFNDGEPCYFSINDAYYLTGEYAVENDINIFDISSICFWDLPWACKTTSVVDNDVPVEYVPIKKWTNGSWVETDQLSPKFTYKNVPAEPVSIAISEMMSKFYKNQEILETVFGDHVQITCTKEEIIIDDCNHD